MEWTKDLISSFSSIALGIPNINGTHHNAILTYSVQTSFSADAEEMVRGEDGNYTFSQSSTQTEERSIKARLYLKQPKFDPQEGMDINLLLVRGHLVEPRTIPPELYSQSNLKAVINEKKGRFTLKPYLESPFSRQGNISEALGEFIEGWFQIDVL